MYDSMVLAENIKRFRKEKGMNQSDFARLLYVSPQAVSKWERGQTTPDIANIVAMTKILGVSIDTLVTEDLRAKEYMIAIDGGGTKTEFALFSDEGHVIQRLKLDGMNPNVFGIEGSLHVLEVGIDTLLVNAPTLNAIFVGGAGLEDEENRKRVLGWLRKKYTKVIIEGENDVANVIESGAHPEECVAAICGTGSVVYTKKAGVVQKFGGYGYLLDSGGSGFEIGKAGINAVLKEQEGMIEHTLITDFLEEKLGFLPKENLSKIYEAGQAYISSCSTCVFSAYENGDRVAEEILRHNAKILAEGICYAMEKSGVRKYVVSSGGNLQKQKAFVKMVEEYLPEDVTMDVPDVPPIYGACLRAAKLMSVDSEEMKKTLRDELREKR